MHSVDPSRLLEGFLSLAQNVLDLHDELSDNAPELPDDLTEELRLVTFRYLSTLAKAASMRINDGLDDWIIDAAAEREVRDVPVFMRRTPH